MNSATIFYLAAFLCFCFQNIAFAQTASTPNGNFEVESVTGCAPFTVSPQNILTGSGSIQYNFDNTLDPSTCSSNYQADPFSCTTGSYTSDNSFTYSSPGTYYLVQLNGNAADGDKVSYVKITVVDPIQPVFELESCANNKVFVTIDFDQDEYDAYQVDFGDGNTSTLTKSGSNTIEYDYASSGNYDISVLGTVAGSSINCSETSKNFTTLDAGEQPEVISVEVIDFNSVQIDYAELDSRLNHQLTIRSQDGSTHLDLGIDADTNPNQITISDAALDFNNTVYGIYIKTRDRCDEIDIPASPTVYTLAVDYTAQYIGAVIELEFNFKTDSDNLTQVNFVENGTLQESFDTETGTTIRALASCEDAQVYAFSAKFGNAISKSAPIAVDLDGTLTPVAIQNISGELNNAVFELQFDEAPIDASFYSIYKKDANGSFQLAGTSSSNNFNDTNLKTGVLKICYAITYTDACGNESKMSDPQCFEISSSTVLVPNAFTPNGDGENDYFKIVDGVFFDFEMRIFNRWGVLLFVSTSSSLGWDGNYNGKPANIGNYVYRLRYKDGANTIIEQSGTFVLIR